MANTRFAYVRKFEQPDALLRDTWIVIRLDGRNFHAFCDGQQFEKPNDARALALSNRCALRVMQEFGDVLLAFGQSDEYSFALPPSSTLYGRRASKLASSFAALFSSSYVFYWREFFGEALLRAPPSFDGRAVCYPTARHLRDYFSWRQADCHINNLYNTAFWKVVHAGSSPAAAEAQLRRTTSAAKHELLFSRFGVNYSREPAIYKKGTVLLREAKARMGCGRGKKRARGAQEDVAAGRGADKGAGSAAATPTTNTTESAAPEAAPAAAMPVAPEAAQAATAEVGVTAAPGIQQLHVDIIGPAFWRDIPDLTDLLAPTANICVMSDSSQQ
eukprot:g4201.t1